MKTANTNTAAKATKTTAAIPHNAIDPVWSFAPDAVTLDGHTFPATYSVAKGGDVYAFATVSDTPVRIHVGKSVAIYDGALQAAVAAKAAKQPAVEKPAEQPAKQAEPKPATPAKAAKQPKAKPTEKPADQPAKQAEPKPATPAKAAKQPKAKPAEKPAEQPAKQAEDVTAKAWIGSAIEGDGWRIVFDDAAQRTRVIFASTPSAKQKAAVEAAGFYWSPTMGSFNKGLRTKAYRAAQALAEALKAL